MKKSTVILTLFLIGATLSFAQVNSNYDGPKPEVRAGAKSFVFMYTPFQSNFNPVYVGSSSSGYESGGDLYFDIESLYGAGFQYYLTNEIALVLGVSFGTSSSEQTITLTDPDGTLLTERSSTGFGLSVDANYHLKALYGVSPYIGINANFSSISGTRDITRNQGTTTTDTYEVSGSGLGAGLNFGFDWYFTEGLSLGGKYTIGFNSFSAPEATYKTGNISTTVEGPSSSSFGTGAASVMLNVHF